MTAPKIFILGVIVLILMMWVVVLILSVAPYLAGALMVGFVCWIALPNEA